MGVGGVSAVSDAGPLIHLAETNGLFVLSAFESLHIPEAVWSETVVRGRIQEQEVLGLRDVRRHALSQAEITSFAEKNHLQDLHSGERECLLLGHKLGVSIILTDDLAVREAAKRLNLIPVGSLGVVVRSYHVGNISLDVAEQHITALYDVSSLFVTRAIVDLAIQQLRQTAGQGSGQEIS